MYRGNIKVCFLNFLQLCLLNKTGIQSFNHIRIYVVPPLQDVLVPHHLPICYHSFLDILLLGMYINTTKRYLRPFITGPNLP